MGNLATKAPNFTSQTAKDRQRNSVASRLANKIARIEREKQLELERAKSFPLPDENRKAETLKQIDRLDSLINSALDDADEDRFIKLSAAKERLWKLVQPTAGVARQRRGDRQLPSAQPISTPQENRPE